LKAREYLQNSGAWRGEIAESRPMLSRGRALRFAPVK
jgi:hypothetical protein